MEWMTTKEVMERLKISLPTILRLRKDGTLPAYKIKKAVRYKSTDVENVFKKED